MRSCAAGCAAAGYCNEAKWRSNRASSPPPPLAPQSYCDDVTARVPQAYSTMPLDEAVGGLEPGSCSVTPGQTECVVWQRELGDAGYVRACAATLLQSVESVTCNIYI